MKVDEMANFSELKEKFPELDEEQWFQLGAIISNSIKRYELRSKDHDIDRLKTSICDHLNLPVGTDILFCKQHHESKFVDFLYRVPGDTTATYICVDLRSLSLCSRLAE